MKVTCIYPQDSEEFIAGKVYEIIDGKIIDEKGNARPMGHRKIQGVSDINYFNGFFSPYTWIGKFGLSHKRKDIWVAKLTLKYKKEYVSEFDIIHMKGFIETDNGYEHEVYGFIPKSIGSGKTHHIRELVVGFDKKPDNNQLDIIESHMRKKMIDDYLYSFGTIKNEYENKIKALEK